jgi:signal transduction histidine kinase
VLDIFEREVPVAESGTIVITQDDLEQNNGVIALKGDFLAVDGIVSPNDFNNSNTDIKYMTLDEIRLYDYPQGTLTAKLTVNTQDVPITGILIDEIHTSYKMFINGELVSSTGTIGTDRKSTIKAKKSAFLPLNDSDDTLEIVIQIANFERINGQLERNVYIGSYEGLQHFYSLKLCVKLICVGIMIAVFFILLGLYTKNKKHKYLLSLSLASIMSLYYLLTHIEPFALFTPTDKAYLIDTWFYTLPALFVLFLCVVTIILFYRIEPLYSHMNGFIKKNSFAFLISILILIYFDKAGYPVYYLMLIYVYGLLIYAGVMCGIRFIQGTRSAVFLFAFVFGCIFYYILLCYVTFDLNPYQTLSNYSIFLVLPQIFFYITLCYFAITHFSKQFSITELSEAELARIIGEKNTQLQQSFDQLKRKDTQRAEMLMNISHDLRSPMTVVQGYADLLNKGKIDQSMYHEYLEIIYNKVSYVIDLINELLALANLETNSNVSMAAENIDVIIDSVIAQYKRDDYSITADIPKDTLIFCNGKNIFRLFCNLLDNAIEYSDDNAEIKISGEISDDSIIIKIKDNGRGIETKNLSYIFERFSTRDTQTNEHGNHFGLGLAICKAIVDKHGGMIGCKSILGEGTTFTITFPLYKGDEDNETADH